MPEGPLGDVQRPEAVAAGVSKGALRADLFPHLADQGIQITMKAHCRRQRSMPNSGGLGAVNGPSAAPMGLSLDLHPMRAVDHRHSIPEPSVPTGSVETGGPPGASMGLSLGHYPIGAVDSWPIAREMSLPASSVENGDPWEHEWDFGAGSTRSCREPLAFEVLGGGCGVALSRCGCLRFWGGGLMASAVGLLGVYAARVVCLVSSAG